MKRRLVSLALLIVLVVGLMGPIPAPMAQGSGPDAPTTEQGSGMPAWPAPRQSIPYHEPGRPSKAAGYTTQVTQLDAKGVRSTVQINGLDAMAADGIDPLAGNYRLVESAQIMSGANTYAVDIESLAPASIGDALAPDGAPYDVAAGDLNGDGIDEQITAWLDVSGRIRLKVGSMPGQGRFTSAPAAISHEDGTLDLLARGLDGSLYHSHYDDAEGWWTSNSAGGTLLSAPAAVSRDAGRFDVFALGVCDSDETHACVYHARWAGGDWDLWGSSEIWQVVGTPEPWPSLEGITPDLELPAPAVTARGDQLDLFRLGPDHTLVHLGFDGAAWDGAWESLGGMLRSAPAAVAPDSNRVQVFAAGVDGALWHRTQLDGSWGPWERLAMPEGVRAESAPTAVSPAGSDEVSVYVRGANGGLWANQYIGGSWQGWVAGSDGVKSTAGQVGGALQFDGVDDYAAADSVTNDLGTGPFSFGGWVYPTRESGGQEALFGFHTASGDNGPILFYHPDEDLFSFYSPNVYEFGTSTFSPNQWYHVMAVIEENGDGTLYVNGASEKTFNTGSRPEPGGRFSIGQEWDNAETSDFFAGRADEVVIFDRALSAGEVSTIYASGWEAVSGKALGLHLDESQAVHGTTLADASGLGNHGTLYTYEPAPAPAPAVGAAYRDDQIDLFVLTEEGTLQWRSEGSWTALQRPLCEGQYTGTTAFDRDYGIKVEAGHFEGAGRELIAVSAVVNSSKNLVVALYGIRDGFHPKGLASKVWDVGFLYSDDDWSDGSEPGKFDFAVGDIEGSGVDSVLAGYIKQSAGDWYFCIDRVWCSSTTDQGGAIDCSTLDGATRLNTKWLYDGGGAEHIHLAAGDIKGDGKDGWAVVVGDIPEDEHESRRYVYDGAGIWDEDHNVLNTWPRPADVAIGNFVAEGAGEEPRDEVVFVSGWAPSSETMVNVYRWDPSGGQLVRIKSWDFLTSETDSVRLEAADLNRDVKEEIVLYYDVGILGTLRILGHDSGSVWKDASTLTLWPNSPVAAGDFRGDSARVGPSSYRVQTRMTTPEVFLNLPPMHRDILSGVGEIQIDNGAVATHYAAHSEEEESTTQSNRDWSLSTGLETSVGGGGHTVTTSLDNTYGESFSRTETDIGSITFEDTTTAAYYDQVIYNGTNYAIWEYPVLGIPAGGEDGAPTISVVFPLVDTTSQPVTQQGRLCDENFYAPGHQTYNVWSYDPLGTAEDFDDYDLEIFNKQTSGGSDFSMTMSHMSQEERSSSSHNQISAGLEYSYENEFSVPLIGKAWDFSFRAYANGSYGSEEISTLRTSFTEASAVGVDFPGTPDPSYTIKAYLYWAKAGYLVVDYQTQPDAGDDTWSLYNKPDPAFVLPWYGFPDPVTGLFPSPPDPDAPPCGLDKQLFTHDIDLDPAYVENGDTVTLSATVRNFSNQNPPGNVTVRFYRGDPAAGNIVGSCTIAGSDLDRDLGPQTCSTTWVVSNGAGEEKIYAVIDPLNAFDEMHDEDDLIDNNVGYGLLYVAGADYIDPGLKKEMPYQEIKVEIVPGMEVTAFLPTVNTTETLRYELVPTPMNGIIASGGLFRLDVYEGGEADPPPSYALAPAPAVLEVYTPGQEITDLKLYRYSGTEWTEVTCADFQTIRFPEADRIFVPVCQLTFSQGSLVGTLALSEQRPGLGMNVFLPLVMR